MLPSAGIMEHFGDLCATVGEWENPETLGDLATINPTDFTSVAQVTMRHKVLLL